MPSNQCPAEKASLLCNLLDGHPGLHYDTIDDISWWPTAPENVPAAALTEDDPADPDFGPDAWKKHSAGCECPDCAAWRQEARGRG